MKSCQELIWLGEFPHDELLELICYGEFHHDELTEFIWHGEFHHDELTELIWHGEFCGGMSEVGGFSKWDERFVSSGEFDPGGDGAGRENFRP